MHKQNGTHTQKNQNTRGVSLVWVWVVSDPLTPFSSSFLSAGNSSNCLLWHPFFPESNTYAELQNEFCKQYYKYPVGYTYIPLLFPSFLSFYFLLLCFFLFLLSLSKDKNNMMMINNIAEDQSTVQPGLFLPIFSSSFQYLQTTWSEYCVKLPDTAKKDCIKTSNHQICNRHIMCHKGTDA